MKYQTLVLIAFLATLSFSRNIIESAGGGALSIVEKKTINVAVPTYMDQTMYWSKSNGTPANMQAAFFRYCAPRQNLPLMVLCIEWGGDIDQTESFVRGVDANNDPFITLCMMPPRQTDAWYWGMTWTDGNGKTWSVPWSHNGVVDLLNRIKYTGLIDSLFPGCTIDTNRIYGYGHSIGGTATDQICIKHPEIFSAFYGHAGWTKYYGTDNKFFGDSRGCLAFSIMIGGIDLGASGCAVDEDVWVKGNQDQTYLPPGPSDYHSYNYTDLGWYLGKTGNDWNYRDPSFPTPFCFFANGASDDPENQGDNLQPSLELSKRGYQYQRINGGHSDEGGMIHYEYMRNFRKNVSYLAFTNRNYGISNFSSIGKFNDLSVHGWDPDSIIDETNHYHAKLTGTGTADVTLRRLQNLVHTPGTVYDVTINNTPSGQTVADEHGLVTIPQVANAASIDLIINISASENASIAQGTCIEANPNPFNPIVLISVGTQYITPLQLTIYSTTGRIVTDLTKKISNGRVAWDASNHPSGLYIVRATMGNITMLKRITLIK